MSDSANAREQSMEDILASIRRIIDEEDTRDARPSSGLDMEVDGSDAPDDGPVPVMAAVPRREEAGVEEVARDADGEDRRDGDRHEDRDEDETIFPERESLFWSRATGRSEAGVVDGEDGGDGSPERAGETGVLAAGAAADIFTRARNKLGSQGRTSARERMHSLVSRAGERTGEDRDEDDEALAVPDFGSRRAEEHDERPADDLSGDDILPDFLSSEGDDETPAEASDADVLELTEPVERGTGSVEALIARAGAGLDRSTRDGDREDDDGVLDLVDPVETVGEGSGTVDSGRVESGAEFHVGDADDASGPGDDRDPVAGPDDGDDREDDHAGTFASADDGESYRTEDAATTDGVPFDQADSEDAKAHEPFCEGSVAEEGAFTGFDSDPDGRGSAFEADDAPAVGNTYSRFDREEERAAPATGDAADAAPGEEGDDPQDEQPRAQAFVRGPADGDDYSAAFTMLTDEGSELETAGHGSTDESGADEDEPFLSGDDAAGSGEDLGFTDTFGASDVYHDEPPVLDDDYSRSLEIEDEPTAAQGAFSAGYDGEEPGDRPDMETVGGLVRDALERDPVDYADPSALVSMTSEEISARALASLTDGGADAGRRMYGSLRISDDGESESIEGMVRGMLRPMLREWLDDNLPSMVESAVRNEVERISAKSRRYARGPEED